MARPTRNNAEYFTHLADFRNDRRIKSIRARFGVAGYGLTLMLIEALTDSDHTQLSTDELEMELLAGDFGVSVTEIYSLLQIAEKIGLFARNSDGNLICPDLNKYLEPVFEKRNRSRTVAQTAKETVSVTVSPVSVTESTQNRVDKSRVKEKEILPDSFEQFWEAYDKKEDRKKCEEKFRKLPESTQQKILQHVPVYVQNKPDPAYRKNPLTYLNGEIWKDPPVASSKIIPLNGHVKQMVV